MVEIYTYKGVSVYWPLSVLCVFVCVPLVIRYQGSTCVDPLSKIEHQCAMITDSPKETGQQKEQWRWGLEVMGK